MTTWWPGLVAALAATLVAPVAGAVGWRSCDDPALTPAAGLERRAPEYPESARISSAEGYVDVAFTVLRDGTVGWVRVLDTEPPGYFEAAALDTVRDWRFAPARLDGEPVECRQQTRVRFRLGDTIAPGKAALPAGVDEPLSRIEPQYPEAARLEEQEGYLEVDFEVLPDGHVRDPAVTLAVPRGVFEAAALAALRTFRYAPAATARRVNRRFDFELPQYAAGRTRPAAFLALARYPPALCAQHVGGEVRLELKLDDTGKVQAARVIDAEPAGLFDATALQTARRSRLAPVYRRGQPIAATALLVLRFDPATQCASRPPARPPKRRGSAPAQRPS